MIIYPVKLGRCNHFFKKREREEEECAVGLNALECNYMRTEILGVFFNDVSQTMERHFRTETNESMVCVNPTQVHLCSIKREVFHISESQQSPEEGSIYMLK